MRRVLRGGLCASVRDGLRAHGGLSIGVLPNRSSLRQLSSCEIGEFPQHYRAETFLLQPSRSTAKNRLLAALPGQDRQRLLAGCEQVELRFADA
jgi:hypothetical protein